MSNIFLVNATPHPTAQAPNDDIDKHPKMSRFEQLKTEVMSTVRGHLYISIACAVTGLALLAILSLGKKGFIPNNDPKPGPDMWDKVACSSCFETHEYFKMQSTFHPIVAEKVKGLLCLKCDALAFRNAIRDKYPDLPEQLLPPLLSDS